MRRVILHSDLNCFYASVEINEHPELAGKKVAVCGSVEDRHGIVLTASYPAKRSGVKTGMAVWQARQVCPELIVVSPHYDLYLRYSGVVRRIYARYSNDVEPFGMDECWISPEGVESIQTGREIAEEIRQTVKLETGLTVSVGVSYNKIFAKLGSDMKKPDAVTVISRENYREKIWPLAASELLYIGRATTKRLSAMCIHTIGDLANADPKLLVTRLGKNGCMLWSFANGYDTSPVMPRDISPPIKSVGHGTTCVHDVESEYEIWQVLYELAQDVGHRLRKYALTARGVQISVRDNALCWEQYQRPLAYPTRSPLELAQTGFALFRERYRWDRPVRSISIRAIEMADEAAPVQTDMFNDYARRERRQTLDDTIDGIRRRFGYDAIRPACLMGDMLLATDKCETVQLPGMMYGYGR